jgi:hypothetical protein
VAEGRSHEAVGQEKERKMKQATLVFADEFCFSLCKAGSLEVARELIERASLHDERFVEALVIERD